MTFHDSIYEEVKEGLDLKREIKNFEEAIELEETARDLLIIGNDLIYNITCIFEQSNNTRRLEQSEVTNLLHILKILSDALRTLPLYCIKERDFTLLFREFDFLYRTCVYVERVLPDSYHLPKRNLTNMLFLLTKHRT